MKIKNNYKVNLKGNKQEKYLKKINKIKSRQKSFDKNKNMNKESISSDEDERKKYKKIKSKTSLFSQSDKNMRHNFNKTFTNNFHTNININKKLNFEYNNNYIINYAPFKQKDNDEDSNIVYKLNNKNNYNSNILTGCNINKMHNLRYQNSNALNVNNIKNNNNFDNNILIKRFYSDNIYLRNNLYSCHIIKKINFVINYISIFGEEVGVLGSIPTLGNWEHNKVTKLKWNNGHIWKGGLYVNSDAIRYFEFKFLILQNNKIKKWEPGENNKFNYEIIYNQIKIKSNGIYDKYNYDYNIYNGELTLNCKWSS